MERRAFLSLCTVVLVACFGTAFAAPIPINLPFYGCKFEVPDNWLINKLDKTSQAAFIADNPAGGKFVLAVKNVQDKVDVTASDFGDLAKDQLKQVGFENLHGEATDFRGNKAYVVDGQEIVTGRTMYCKVVMFQIGTVLYTLNLSKFDVKPDKDPDYLRILESFELSN